MTTPKQFADGLNALHKLGRKPTPWRAVAWRPALSPRMPRRALAWACEAFPGVTVRHCGHPTALRPYYVQGSRALERALFRTLAQAQDGVRQVTRDNIEDWRDVQP